MKFQLIKICLISTILTFAAGSWAGDGSGINGPNLRGPSVPAALDGALTVDQVKDVVDYCYIFADTSLLKRLGQQLFNEPIGSETSRLQVASQSRVFFDGNPPLQMPIFSGLLLDRTAPESPQLVSIGMGVQEQPQFTVMARFHAPELFAELGPKDAKSHPFPYIRWSKMEKICDDYDEFGECVSEHTYARGAHVERGVDQAESVSLYNTTTGAPTPLIVNPEEVYQCLKAQMRKAAIKQD